MREYLKENIFNIVTAVGVLFAIAFYFINYQPDDKELQIFGEFDGTIGYITPSGMAIDWKFNTINNSESDIIITEISTKSFWGDATLLRPTSHNNTTMFLKPIKIPARSSKVLSISTHHNVNDEMRHEHRDVLIELGHMTEQERNVISNRNLKLESDQISFFLNKLWERNFGKNKSEGETFWAKSFSFVFSTECGVESINRLDPIACISSLVRTSDGQQFESNPTMAGFYSQLDCHHTSNEGLCEFSDSIIDLTDGGCITLSTDDLGNIKTEVSDCQR